MPDGVVKPRPWYKVRRVWGGILGTTALALASIPGAPAIVTVGVIAITTQTVSILVGGVATYVFGWGVVAAIGRETDAKVKAAVATVQASVSSVNTGVAGVTQDVADVTADVAAVGRKVDAVKTQVGNI